ncbi:hypothetical protein [Rhodococcus sp. ABRD24]|nr:hypothetical protein [Rhodococcus sp. ABRD24]
MGSADLIPAFKFLTDFADAAGDLFAALSFFAGSLETVSGVLG